MSYSAEISVAKAHKASSFFAFFYLYALQGIPSGFALTTLTNYLISRGVSSSSVASFGALVGLPWFFQLIWGPLIDKYKYSLWGKQKYWVIATMSLAFSASLILCFIDQPDKNLLLISVAFFIHSTFASIQDASVDSLAISSIPVNERGRVNAFMRGGFLIGVSFGAVVLSIILHSYGFRSAAILQSILLLSGIIYISLIHIGNEHLPETRRKTLPLSELFTRLYKGFRQRHSLHFISFLFLIYCCFSMFSRSFIYYILNDLRLPDKDLSVTQGIWGGGITFLVIIGFGQVADSIGPRKLTRTVLWVTGVFILVVGLVSLWYVDRQWVLSGLVLWNFADPVLSVAVFPVLMALCSEHVEGSQFTTYMAFINLGDIAGFYLTGWMLEAVNGRYIAIACGVILLLSIILIKHQKILNEYQRIQVIK